MRLWIFAVALLSAPGAAAASQEARPWPMFHGSAQHAGQAAVNGPHTATLRWRYRYASAGRSRGDFPKNFAVDRDGRVYTNAAGRLVAFAADGEVLWSSSDLRGGGAVALSPDGSRLYVAARSRLLAFSSSGQQLWTFDEAGRDLHDEPTVALDGSIYFGSWDSYAYALEPDGRLRWRFRTDGAIAPMASPTLSRDGETLYVASGDPNFDPGGSLYALARDGSLRWNIERLDGQRASGVVVGPDGTLYVAAARRLHAIRPDGTRLWRSPDGTASSLPPSLSSSGVLYAGTGPDGKVYAIDAATGAVRWSYQTGANPDPERGNRHDPEYGVLTTPVIGADGVVYVGAMDGVFYALEPDGSLLWSYRTGDNVNEMGPAIGPDGTLYFSSADGHIYAIRDP